MNHIQHFGSGALVATFAIFAASAIDTNAQYFAVENANAIYSQGASVALTTAVKATDGKRAVNNFTPGARTDSTNRRAIEVRGIVTSVSGDKITVKNDANEWTGVVTDTTKFPVAHGAAVQIKASSAGGTTTPPAPTAAPTTDQTQGNPAVAPATGPLAQIQVGDRVVVTGRTVGNKTIRLTMVRDLDVRSGTSAGAASVNPVAPKVGITPVVTSHPTVGVRGKFHPDPMPMPIVPVDQQQKPTPGVAQPVPQPRD